jgi:transposase-like protein
MKRKVKRFPDELALKIALEYLTTDISQSELKKKYGFTGNMTLYHWIAKFGLSKPSDKEIELQKAMGKEKSKTPEELKLEAEIAALKKELEYEKLRTLALNTLIDVAERDLNISIRKKPGAKQ